MGDPKNDLMERIEKLWAELDEDPEYLNECTTMLEKEFHQQKAENDRLKREKDLLIGRLNDAVPGTMFSDWQSWLDSRLKEEVEGG